MPEFKSSFGKLMLTVTTILGIRNEPEKITMDAIYELITGTYSHLSMEEIYLAFKLHETGKLKQKFEHFQLMTLQYFSNIIHAYDHDERRTTLNRIQLSAPTPVHTPQTDEETYNGLVKYYNDNGHFPSAWNWKSAYQHATDTGIIDPLDKRKFKIFDLVKAELKAQDETKKLQKLDVIISQNLDESFESRVKSESIKRFMQEVIKENKG